MKRITLFFISVLILTSLGVAAQAKDAACSYTVDPKSIQVSWTGFKFNERKGVPGTFNQSQVRGKFEAKSLAQLMNGLNIEIESTTVETKDMIRNSNLQTHFFGKFRDAGKILAQVIGVQGDDSAGKLVMKITMNGVHRQVPFIYNVNTQSVLEAKAKIDVMDFKLQSPFAALQHACGPMHTGKDGVAKTWTEVELRVSGIFSKQCL